MGRLPERDADGDGIAETRSVFLKDLNSPFGMALIGNDLYVAATDALLRFFDIEAASTLQAPLAPATVAPAAIARPWTSVRREIIDSGSRCTSRVITSSQCMRRPVDPVRRPSS